MGSVAQTLIGALLVGLPTLAWTVYRGRRMGPKEEDELVSRSSQQAVEMMGSVLDTARREREELLDRLTGYETKEREQMREMDHLRSDLRAAQRRIDVLEDELGELRSAI